MYNGLNPQCDMSGFLLQYDNTNITLNFPTDGPLIPEDKMDFVPQNANFTVIPPDKPVNCGDLTVNFSPISFTGPPGHVVRSQ